MTNDDIIMTFKSEFRGKMVNMDKTIRPEISTDSFLLGLAIESFAMKLRDAMVKELRNSGYEVDVNG